MGFLCYGWICVEFDDIIRLKGNKFVIDVKIKFISDLKFDDSWDCDFLFDNFCIIFIEKWEYCWRDV